ncbi:SDR family oxidoreductase [Pseudonocardia nigra]|uniref:SDR family oxidoreductase n=1 Tax=Pseudonocardia nigra TaxID=1921578 RepID=UPI001FE79191|nr:SDR family oxidoreductase [Pseudonocardia nigra]
MGSDGAPRMPTAFTVQGRLALVTGAGTGIGRAIALALAGAGADLLLLSEKDDLDDVAAEARSTGGKVQTVQLDLADPERRRAETERLLDANAVDILVNNAGLIRRAPAEDFPDGDWYDVLEVNLHAAFELCRAAGRRMVARGHGKIVNVASLLSFQGGLYVPSYAASKHALVGLTRALANEWAGRGVNVNAIAPGYVATATTDALRNDPARSREILARIPAGRWAEPADIAGSAVFLASPAADYVHGHVLVVDGGWLAR